MGYNIGTTTVNNVGHGPAVVFLGASGTTPTVDVGVMGNEGETNLEFVATKERIKQGNPAKTILKFATVHEVYVAFQGLEWDFDQLAYGLGAGNTTSSASQDTLVWGGDPVIDEVAIHVRHYMVKAADTLNVYAWTCSAEDDVTVTLGQSAHTFPYRFEVHRSTTNWAGGALATEAELVKIVRQKT